MPPTFPSSVVASSSFCFPAFAFGSGLRVFLGAALILGGGAILLAPVQAQTAVVSQPTVSAPAIILTPAARQAIAAARARALSLIENATGPVPAPNDPPTDWEGWLYGRYRGAGSNVRLIGAFVHQDLELASRWLDSPDETLRRRGVRVAAIANLYAGSLQTGEPRLRASIYDGFLLPYVEDAPAGGLGNAPSIREGAAVAFRRTGQTQRQVEVLASIVAHEPQTALADMSRVHLAEALAARQDYRGAIAQLRALTTPDLNGALARIPQLERLLAQQEVAARPPVVAPVRPPAVMPPVNGAEPGNVTAPSSVDPAAPVTATPVVPPTSATPVVPPVSTPSVTVPFAPASPPSVRPPIQPPVSGSTVPAAPVPAAPVPLPPTSAPPAPVSPVLPAPAVNPVSSSTSNAPPVGNAPVGNAPVGNAPVGNAPVGLPTGGRPSQAVSRPVPRPSVSPLPTLPQGGGAFGGGAFAGGDLGSAAPGTGEIDLDTVGPNTPNVPTPTDGTAPDGAGEAVADEGDRATRLSRALQAAQLAAALTKKAEQAAALSLAKMLDSADAEKALNAALEARNATAPPRTRQTPAAGAAAPADVAALRTRRDSTARQASAAAETSRQATHAAQLATAEAARLALLVHAAVLPGAAVTTSAPPADPTDALPVAADAAAQADHQAAPATGEAPAAAEGNR